MVLENFIVDAPIVWDRVGKKIFENPHVKQGRKMRVQITNAGMVEDLSGYALALGWKHTVSGVDGLDVFEDSSEANVGIFEMAYTENLMTNLGNLKASLVLTSVEDMVVAESNDFYVKVDDSPFGADAEQGVGSYTRLAQILLNEESRIAAEVARVSAEETRVTDFNALVDSEIIAQNVATKLQAKEAEYLPRLVSNEQQLAETNLLTENAVSKANVAAAKADAMASGSPKGVYATLALLQAAYPTGTTGAYLVTADGKWYYWSATAWVVGGTYQSTGVAKGSIQATDLSTLLKGDLYDIQNQLNGLSVINDTTGRVWTGGNSVGTTRVIDSRIKSESFLKQVIVKCFVGGSLKIKVLKRNIDGTFNFIRDIVKTVVVGDNYIELNEIVYPDYYLGVYSDTARISTVPETPGSSYFYLTGNVVANNVTLTAPATGTKMAVSFTLVSKNENAENLKYLDVQSESVGFVENSGAPSTVNSTYLIDKKYTDSCLLKRLTIFAKTTGTLIIKAFSTLDDIDFTFIKEISVSVTQTGLNVLTCSLDIPKNGYIGLYSTDATFTLTGSALSEKYYFEPGNIKDTRSFQHYTNSYILVNAITVKYDGVSTDNTPKKGILQGKGNDIKPMYIKTMDKTNQPLHPSVLHIPAGFGGYRYWMVETALPQGLAMRSSRYEVPHIHCSADGINWIDPVGLVNPIDDLTESEIADYTFMSDPHLVLKNGVLECWYRISRPPSVEYPGFTAPTWLLRKTSTDGVTWTTRETLNNYQDPASTLYNMARSPSVMWDGSKYKMWFVDQLETETIRNVCYAESLDGYTWSNRVTCVLNGLLDDNWHIDVSYSKNRYHLIIYGQTNQNLNYYRSIDGINFTFVEEILRASRIKGSNFMDGLYRSSLVFNGSTYMLYMTAKSATKYSLMLASGTSLDKLEFVDGNYYRDLQVFEKGISIINNGVMSSAITLTEKGTSIGVDYDTEKVYIKLANGTKIYLN